MAYALGEAYEFETQLIIAHSYQLLNREITNEFIERIQILQKMIAAFIQSLQA
ncbi:MAG: four helix bundle protein [Saprospiraceae bacterium]|nr:four helix bundle protein [Saprospiraceae bacterium]